MRSYFALILINQRTVFFFGTGKASGLESMQRKWERRGTSVFSYSIKCTGHIINNSMCMSIKHYAIDITYMMIYALYILFTLKSSGKYT